VTLQELRARVAGMHDLENCPVHAPGVDGSCKKEHRCSCSVDFKRLLTVVLEGLLHNSGCKRLLCAPDCRIEAMQEELEKE